LPHIDTNQGDAAARTTQLRRFATCGTAGLISILITLWVS
jgi:hypothetical protein